MRDIYSQASTLGNRPKKLDSAATSLLDEEENTSNSEGVYT